MTTDAHAVVRGVGFAVPPTSLAQEQTLARSEALDPLDADTTRFRRSIYLRCGVVRRGAVSAAPEGAAALFEPGGRGPTTAARLRAFERLAPDLAAPACTQALTRAEVDAPSITHLITASCTGMASPGVDRALIERLGLSPTIARTTIGFMGCHAAINALRVARALALAGDRVLVCCVELCSLHFKYQPTPDQIVASALFADGSAAAVIERGPPRGSPRLLSSASCLLDDSEGLMTWRVGDHGFEMSLDSRVPDRIAEVIRDWLTPWLAASGFGVRDIGSWMIHPGGPRVLSAVAQALDLDDASLTPSRSILADHGNMSSGTVLAILHRLQQSGEWKPPGVMLAFGPGLTAEAILLG